MLCCSRLKHSYFLILIVGTSTRGQTQRHDFLLQEYQSSGGRSNWNTSQTCEPENACERHLVMSWFNIKIIIIKYILVQKTCHSNSPIQKWMLLFPLMSPQLDHHWRIPAGGNSALWERLSQSGCVFRQGDKNTQKLDEASLHFKANSKL